MRWCLATIKTLSSHTANSCFEIGDTETLLAAGSMGELAMLCHQSRSDHDGTRHPLCIIRDFNKALFHIFLPKSPNWLQSKGKPYEKTFKKLTGFEVDSVDDENNASAASQDLKSLIEKENCENQARKSRFIVRLLSLSKKERPRSPSLGLYFEFPFKGVNTVHFLHFEEQKYFEVCFEIKTICSISYAQQLRRLFLLRDASPFGIFLFTKTTQLLIAF